MKHHSHTIDTLAFLLGDPQPVWAEGRLVLDGDPLDDGSRKGPREGTDMHQRSLPLPTLNVGENRFVPPDGMDFADPLLDFSRVGYDSGAEAVFIPVEPRDRVRDSWDRGPGVRMGRRRGHSTASQGGRQRHRRRSGLWRRARVRPSPRFAASSNELETGERTSGNIDVTHKVCEAEFGLAWSHVQGSCRIDLPVEGVGRSLHIPNH